MCLGYLFSLKELYKSSEHFFSWSLRTYHNKMRMFIKIATIFPLLSNRNISPVFFFDGSKWASFLTKNVEKEFYNLSFFDIIGNRARNVLSVFFIHLRTFFYKTVITDVKIQSNVKSCFEKISHLNCLGTGLNKSVIDIFLLQLF